MGLIIAVVLVIIAILLFVANTKGVISGQTLQNLASVAGIVALLAAILVFIFPAAQSAPNLPGLNIFNSPTATPNPLYNMRGRIAFIYSSSHEPKRLEIINANGKENRIIQEGVDNSVSIEPYGKRLAVSIMLPNKNKKIYVMDDDGKNSKTLTNDVINTDTPSWSPDGSMIAFRGYNENNRDIYIINVDGTNLTRLTSEDSDEGYPSWSPDGKYIAFESNRDGNYNIYRIDVDTRELMQLTFKLKFCKFAQAWRVTYDRGNIGSNVGGCDASDHCTATGRGRAAPSVWGYLPK